MDTSTAPVCPACGFRVFNRRYPKCESCGAALPDTIVYTPVERHALLAADEERQLEHDRHERLPAAGAILATSDDALMATVLNLTPDA